MPRLTQLTDEKASPETAELFGAIKGKVGMVPNLYRVVGNQPAALAGLLTFGEELGKGNFDAGTREAIALAVAGANSCGYCASAHTAISKNLGVPESEIVARRNGKSDNPRIEAILKFAIAVVEERGFVSDEEIAAARTAGLTDADIVETIANVVANIFTNYINHVAETDIDFPVVDTNAA